MYWNNPLIELPWPSARDPIQESLHQGQHAIFFDSQASIHAIKTNQRLQDLCDWANLWLQHDGIDGFVADQRNHYDIANLVKLNMWIEDIRRQGIVKPWLLLDEGDGSFTAGTGDSRLRCLERLPHITKVAAFICTTRARQHLYSSLEPIENFDTFAARCQALPNEHFLFRLTDPAAPYGLYWYEYSSARTRRVTPGEQQAVDWFTRYARTQPGLKVLPEWFDRPIDWSAYDAG